MECDWYAATIKDLNIRVLDTLSTEYVGGVKQSRGKNGYENSFQILDGNKNPFFTLLYGGNNGASPHAFATSENAIKFRQICRHHWADHHSVTRIDVCEDFPNGGFGKMAKMLIKLAERKGLWLSQMGDWARSKTSKQGRTLYIGSPTSACRVRLYEKGKQLAEEIFYNKGFKPLDGFPIDWVRLELQVRPVKHQRELAAKSDLSDLWGYAQWTQEVGNELLTVDAARCSADEYRNNDIDTAIAFMVKQYGRVLSNKADELGGWDALGQHLELIQQQHKMLKRVQ